MSNGPNNKNNNRTICINKITGIPIVKVLCLVLWRKRYMATIEPMLPPIIATRKRVPSGIRKALLFALNLSIPINENAIKLVIPKYIRITEVTDKSVILKNYKSSSPLSIFFMARTFVDKPKRLMKPSASWWSYKSPVVNDAMLSSYNV